MVIRNLTRRKGRTILTVFSVSIGVAAIIALGAMAQGMRAGLTAMSRGSQADLVLTQAEQFTILMSSIDEGIVDQLRTWPEVDEADGVFLSNVQSESASYFYLFGHDPSGFAIDHFRIIEGQDLDDVRDVRGKPLLLGRRAAEGAGKQVGDTIGVTGGVFRIVGIYETGDAFEEGGAVIPIEEAQALALQPHRVTMVYIQLRRPDDAGRLRDRVARSYPEMTLSTSTGFADQQQNVGILEGLATAVSGLALLVGGLGMANTLLMSVFERTREIGLLRALGWRRRRVLGLILREAFLVGLLGGVVGAGLGVGAVFLLRSSASFFGVMGGQFTPDLFVRAFVTVIAMGLVGGAYPAWWASRLLPVEALRYEGGSSGEGARASGSLVKSAGMAGRNLWRRRTRTVLTIISIALSITVIIALGALAQGGIEMYTRLWRASQTDLVAVEAGVSDGGYSAINERVGARIAARSDVDAVSGMILTAVTTEDMPLLMVFGYHPREFAIRHFRVVEGEPLAGSRQMIVGRQAAEATGLEVGDVFRMMDSNYRVVGIFETGLAYEEISVVVSLRDAQSLTGRPRQVMMYALNLEDPGEAERVRDELRETFPGVDFSLTAEFSESLNDFETMTDMVQQISSLAVFIGGLGMLNTMLMSVLERTREIGVFRALGWRRRHVLGMVLREALVLGAVGGVVGVALGLGLTRLVTLIPGLFGSIDPTYPPELFVQAIVVALGAGLVGGLYPAWRAARMHPAEALRYE